MQRSSFCLNIGCLSDGGKLSIDEVWSLYLVLDIGWLRDFVLIFWCGQHRERESERERHREWRRPTDRDRRTETDEQMNRDREFWCTSGFCDFGLLYAFGPPACRAKEDFPVHPLCSRNVSRQSPLQQLQAMCSWHIQHYSWQQGVQQLWPGSWCSWFMVCIMFCLHQVL